jgi:serralysin
VSIWEMNGTNIIGHAPVADPGPSWHVIGTGDFNGDGKSDILLQNTDGQVSIWEMNGTNIIGHAPVADPGPSVHAIGTGAGASDILLQNTNGQASIWGMNGTSIVGGGPMSINPGPTWHTIGLT